MFGKKSCPWTGRAITILERDKVDFDWVDLEEPEHEAKLVPLVNETKQHTVPFIYLRGQFIGGFNALAEIERLGQLEFALMTAEERARRRRTCAASRSCRARTPTKSRPPTKSRAETGSPRVAGVAGVPDLLASAGEVPTFWFILARDADLLRDRDLVRELHARRMPTNSTDVLARNLAARGGADKLRAIKSLRATGKVTLGGGNFSLTADFAQVIQRPNRVRNELTLQGLTRSARTTARRWRCRRSRRRDAEQHRPTTGVRSSSRPSSTGRSSTGGEGPRVEYLGTEDVDGTEAHKLGSR